MKPALSPRLSRRSPPARHWPRLAVALVCAFALGAPLTAGADSEAQTTLSPGLLDAAQAEPDEAFRVIVEGVADTATVSEEVRGVASDDEEDLRSFLTVPAVAGTLTGSQIVALAEGPEPLVITRDSPVVSTEESRPDEPTAPAASEEPTVAGDAEPGHWLTATPGAWSGSGTPGYSFQWDRCGSDQRSAAMLTGSPAGHWVAGDLEGGMRVGGLGGGTFSSAFTFEAWVEPGEARTDRTLVSRWVEPPEGFTDQSGPNRRDPALSGRERQLRPRSRHLQRHACPNLGRAGRRTGAPRRHVGRIGLASVPRRRPDRLGGVFRAACGSTGRPGGRERSPRGRRLRPGTHAQRGKRAPRGMCRDPGGRRGGLSRRCRRPRAEPPRRRDRHGRG